MEEQVIDTDGQVLTKTTKNGTIVYRNAKGKQHRIGGPAYIGSNGTQEEYLVDDNRHRIGGPAVIYPDGTQQYWVEGKLHRIGGPAVIYSDGTQSYWVEGIKYTEELLYRQAVIAYELKQNPLGYSGRTNH